MLSLGYNTGVNHIKSSGLLKQHRYPFSTDVRGIDTMSYSTREPYFPENLNDYAPWVAKYGLTAPYGKCQCGCGNEVSLAKQTETRVLIAKGKPLRFSSGHNLRVIPPTSWQERFFKHVTPGPFTECWIWRNSDKKDYYGRLFVDGRTQQAHRMAWELYRGPIPDGMLVCHKCDTPSCCNPYHAFLGTDADNSHDKEKKGRGNHPRGESNTEAKLTEADILEIRSLWSQGVLQVEIAKQFGIRQNHVSRIVRRESWSHI